MRFVNSTTENLDQKRTDQTEYNKLGKMIEDRSERVFAQYTVVYLDKDTQQRRTTILIHKNKPYDPYGTDGHREAHLELSLKPVNARTFDLYLKYLQTRNSLYMTQAQRSFING